MVFPSSFVISLCLRSPLCLSCHVVVAVGVPVALVMVSPFMPG